ncbi:hypothetical protein GMJAKD_16820 [Candidatus Electrothrix aarhusensis]
MEENMSKKRTLVSFDWAIKNILRDKANYDVLEGFLSTLLDKDITILSVLESEGNQQDESDKFNRVDLAVEEWDYLFRTMDSRPDVISKKIQVAAEKLNLLKMSKKERRTYEHYLINRAVKRDMMETARIEGQLEGKLEIAANMLKKGKSCEEIAELTGLRSEQIRELEQRKEIDDPTKDITCLN